MALLVVISVVLGIGTFVAVLVALAATGSTTTDGEPSDAILLGHALVGMLSALLGR